MSGISRTVLREQVKDLLLQRIASELGTSQAPVREALRDLEQLRLVESEPFKGARVRAFGNAELVEVYPVRAVLEELAAKEATKRLAGDVSGLEAEVEAMRAAARRGDLNSLVRHDIAFHRLIVEAAGNPVLAEMLDTIFEKTQVLIRRIIILPGRAEVGRKQHVAMLQAMCRGDAAQAETIRRDGLNSAKLALEKYQRFIL